MPYLSVVIPLYKCSTALAELIRRLEETMGTINDDYELVFVNDGSPENDWEKKRFPTSWTRHSRCDAPRHLRVSIDRYECAGCDG